MRPLASVAVVAALGAAVVGGFVLRADDGYTVNIVMPAATNLVPGSDVQVDGTSAGRVKELTTRDGRAIARVELTDRYAPLHDGTTSRIAWKAVLGERIIELRPGPERNPVVPDGALIEGAVDRVEIDQVLAALDPPTRERLKSLVQRLRQTLDGNEDELNATLRAAGPALEALGQVLEAVGNDGPAIRSLVERLYTMTATLTARQDDVSAVIGQLSRTSRATAAQQAQLRAALQELPPTLEVAQRTLDDVPPTVDKTVPLLAELRPATQRLTSVSRNLSPLLSDLRPAVADLKPTLVAAQSLLQVAPGLLDGAHATLPGINTAAGSAQPALSFLRPYTPELAGWLSNWGSASAGYDGIGHYMRAFVQQGGSSVNANPGVLPPGNSKNIHREPGENEGQPWTDATGSSLR